MSEYEDLLVRLADIGDVIDVRRLPTGALQVYASIFERIEFEWVTQIDERSCDYCDSQSGRIYRFGQFMPEIPAHPNCRCYWRLIIT